MKSIAFIIAMLVAVSGFSQNYNVTYRSKLTFPGQTLANIWGIKKNGKEYALVGASQGLVIVDVTNPASPFVLTQVTDGINSLWREIKTFGNYAYITSEGTSGGLGGLGIANLSNLPNTSIPFHKYYGDGAINNMLQRAHALHVDTIKGYAYIFGCTGLASGGAVALNLNTDPYNPVYAGQYSGSYIHDGYVHNDTMYAGRIYAGQFSIINFTNKSAPAVISTQTTPNAFTHNTWLSANGNYLFTTDEKSDSWLAAYNINDPTNIIETDRIQTTPGSGSIVHNTHVKDNYAVSSWYKDGITITDVSRPSNLIQVGRYDTWPGSGNGFDGAWGVYPYLPSGNLLVTNIDEDPGSGSLGALYVLTPTYVSACFLEGNVKDIVSSHNLSGVSVVIQHTDPLNSTTTTSNGNYATGQPTAGTFNVVFSKAGYISQTIAASISNGNVTTLNVEMTEAPLPLELLLFTANADGNYNLLEWTTAQEKNTLRHEIQRNNNPDQPFVKIGEVPPNGNTDTETEYTFTDHSPSPESYYRLRMLDLDGTEQFSDIEFVKRPLEGFEIAAIYPVPSSGIIRLDISSSKLRFGQMTIGDMSGKILLEQDLELQPGGNFKEIHLPGSWPDGQYWLRVNSEKEMKQGTFVLKR